MEHPYKRGFGFIVDSDALHSLTTLKASQSMHRKLYGSCKHFFFASSADRNVQWVYEGTAELNARSRMFIRQDKHVESIRSRCRYPPKYVAVSYRWKTAGADEILDSSQMERLRRALELLSRGGKTSFVLWFDRVFSEAVQCNADWAWKGTAVYRYVTAIMLDPPGSMMTNTTFSSNAEKPSLSFWIFAEHALAGTQGRKYVQCYADEKPCWKTVADCDPESLIFAVFRYGLTSHGKGRIRWGGLWRHAMVTLLAHMGETNKEFERVYIDAICKFVFTEPTHCFSVLPNCERLAEQLNYADMQQIEKCAGKTEIVQNGSGLFIQFPARGLAFSIRHVCGLVYHVEPKQLSLQSGKRVSEADDLIFGQDTIVNVEDAQTFSPWTMDKLRYLDTKLYGIHNPDNPWNTDFVEEIEDYKGLKVCIANLQPLAVFIRQEVTFYVDAFSIDSGERGSKKLSQYSKDTHDPRNGDLSAWEKVQEVGLLQDIANGCKYELVLHRAVWIGEICLVEFGMVNPKTIVGCPTKNLDEYVSGVTRSEEKKFDYVNVGVTFKYMIHQSLNNADMDGEDLSPLYEKMKTVNEQLNKFESPGEEKVDWLMAAKVMQRSRRDGRFRWAATVGKALRNNFQSSPSGRSSEWRDSFKMAGRVALDVLIRDAHRVIGVGGGGATIGVGAARSDWGVVAAGVTLILAALSSSTKKAKGGRRSATREVLLNSGTTFAEGEGCYGRTLKPDGDMAEPLEVGILRSLGYSFKLDVAGNVMCETRDKEVRGCTLRNGHIHMEQASATHHRLLDKDAELESGMLVGGRA